MERGRTETWIKMIAPIFYYSRKTWTSSDHVKWIVLSPSIELCGKLLKAIEGMQLTSTKRFDIKSHEKRSFRRFRFSERPYHYKFPCFLHLSTDHYKIQISRGGMHNEGVPWRANVIPFFVAAQCCWMRTFREFLPLHKNWLITSLCIPNLGGRGSSAVERATPGEEVPGSIPAVAARSLQVVSASL